MDSRPVFGLLFSQVGYDAGDPKRALIRCSDPSRVPADAVFALRDPAAGNAVFTGPVVPWGMKWGSMWWVMDFSALNAPGAYDLFVTSGESVLASEGPVRVDRNILWNETFRIVGLEQFEERARRARNGVGWKDCGSEWREANSHAASIIGLCDAWAMGYEWMTEDEARRLKSQVIHGCAYLCACQDKAGDLGLPKGAVVHEIPNHMTVIPADVAQTAAALGYASRLLADTDRERSTDYLQRAVASFEYGFKGMRPYGPSGFSHSNHGAPEGFRVPDGFMTRDLLMLMDAGLQLCASGLTAYKDDVKELARRVMRRQVPRERAEGGLYGHFYTFDGCGFTEKANTHHHVGHDTGSTFPFFVPPFVEMCGRWYDDPEAADWRRTLKDFAEGFFVPACMQNPFHIIPEGHYLNEGLLWFAGPWHGINASIVLGAVVAMRLQSVVGSPELRSIAVGCVQWLAGLNAGITKEAFKGCVLWRGDAEVPEGIALPYSQIEGIGNRSIKGWSGIRGSIVNGFDTNPQFRLVVPPTLENDGPWLYTDEDWIPHAAAWLSAVSHLRQARFFEGY